MGFVSILVALLLEQARPLSRGNTVHLLSRMWVRAVGRSLDTGRHHHAALAWIVGVLVPGLLAAVVYWAVLSAFGWPFAVLWNIAVLYVTLGFRQFSFHFTEIRNALDAGESEQARQRLAAWRHVDLASLPRDEVVRQVVEHSVLAAHRHVFGVLAAFSIASVLGLGPAGAVVYRLGEFVPRYWKVHSEPALQPVSEQLQALAARCWHVIDWLPARITAVGFAVVGSFEEAIESWRRRARAGTPGNDAIILAATAGAVNLRLQDETQEGGEQPGAKPEVGHLRTVVGLVWRTVLMWMILLALLTLARLLG